MSRNHVTLQFVDSDGNLTDETEEVDVGSSRVSTQGALQEMVRDYVTGFRDDLKFIGQADTPPSMRRSPHFKVQRKTKGRKKAA